MKNLIKQLGIFLFIIMTMMNTSVAETSANKRTANDIKKDKLIGTLIKSALENYHYRALVVNDAVSLKAFDEYIKKIDYGKQFLYKSDVEELKKYNDKFDDELQSGKHSIIEAASKIIKKRVNQAEALRAKLFKKKFKFDGKDTLELDPEKITWVSNDKEFVDHWTKLFKHFTLSRYLSLIDENKDNDDKTKRNKLKKEKKNKKKKKKLSNSKMISKAHEKVSKRYKKIFKRMIEKTHVDNMENFVNSIATIFDPHTSYFPPKRKEDFDIDISGSLEGIGAVLQEEDEYIKVVRIVPGGAAWRQKGLEVDDIILEVRDKFKAKEGVDLVGMGVDKAVRYIRGPKNTIVNLTVKKVDGTRKVVPIVRDIIQIAASKTKSSIVKHKNLDLKIGYIYVPKFYRDFQNSAKNCSNDVKKKLESLKKHNIDAIILDLRNNGGGALEDARLMSGLFIEKGPIVQIKDHQGKIDILRDMDSNVTYEGPLIVMTNRFSASASEILAGALQDYKRAVIVGGEFSHGKGTVQAVLDLNRNPIAALVGGAGIGALKVTIQKFYRVSGASTQYKGVTPDIILPDPFAYTKSREKDLENSLEWDQVKALNYTVWNKEIGHIPLLQKRSSKRIMGNDRYDKLKRSLKFLIEKREDTKVSLNKSVVQAEDEKNTKLTKQLKLDKESKDILISHYEESRDKTKIKKEDEEHWQEDFDKRKEEWFESLRKDVGLEEALFIAKDMVDLNKGKKLSMVK
ncbi:MAG: carboxy terminal-processing peptidase [Bacteriovoracaceae bacterium]|jgi:carboxyl-terminal processing protease|nr:carboxy terminal-processing peptidase [Bacteriovoracaceae bacterium]